MDRESISEERVGKGRRLALAIFFFLIAIIPLSSQFDQSISPEVTIFHRVDSACDFSNFVKVEPTRDRRIKLSFLVREQWEGDVLTFDLDGKESGGNCRNFGVQVYAEDADLLVEPGEIEFYSSAEVGDYIPFTSGGGGVMWNDIIDQFAFDGALKDQLSRHRLSPLDINKNERCNATSWGFMPHVIDADETKESGLVGLDIFFTLQDEPYCVKRDEVAYRGFSREQLIEMFEDRISMSRDLSFRAMGLAYNYESMTDEDRRVRIAEIEADTVKARMSAIDNAIVGISGLSIYIQCDLCISTVRRDIRFKIARPDFQDSVAPRNIDFDGAYPYSEGHVGCYEEHCLVEFMNDEGLVSRDLYFVLFSIVFGLSLGIFFDIFLGRRIQ
ncbi:MAG: hypothetical protein ABJK59_09460 [Erythrobacter sp.]|uniref:hypothetical protein n=1 Tax=Erythrobacter sp. TaxID=1042 RepID=UPI0032991CC3